MTAEKLLQIIQKIRAAEIQYQRPKNSVQLIAVSKAHSVNKIVGAHQAGQIAFAENYVQEAILKQKLLQTYPIQWHFIGNIQSNKTKLIAENFDWVHSVSDLCIAEKLNKYRPRHYLPLNILLQINLNAQFESLLKLASDIVLLENLKLRGCMVISEKLFGITADFQHKLIQNNFSLDTLSMGMSNNFELAIKMGSNMVRIGTALFGKRD